MKVLIPLPLQDFDPTEAAVPWKILTLQGVEVYFATPDGKKGSADPKTITGKGLGILKISLMVKGKALEAFIEMEKDPKFMNPMSYSEIKVNDFDGVILPGGHAQGMRPYLESKTLQEFMGDFFDEGKLIGAICHGLVLSARSLSKKTGKPIIYGKEVTALTKWMELSAWRLTKLWLKDYFLTYPGLTVEDEVKKAIGETGSFKHGPFSLLRDTPKKLNRGFVVKDGKFISSRWPGDAHQFGHTFLNELLKIK